MYINFWYPVCTSAELEDKPLRVTLLTLRFAAFRDSAGVAHVVSDTCIHRGGSLSKGWVQGDNIVCPYHGWQYSGAGRCAKIPSQKTGSPPARAKVDSYPVEERYGIVFAFLGDLPESERPAMFEIPEVGQEGWRASIPATRVVKCYYERSIENGLDPMHNEFVHPSQGLPKMREETVKITENEWGTHFIAAFGEQTAKPEGEKEIESDPNTLRAGSLYHGPNILVTDIHFDATSAFLQYAFEAPIDEEHTRIYLVNLRNCMMDPKLDERVIDINNKVADEDQVILEDLWPMRTPDTMNRELLTTGDEIVVRYRKHLKEWDARGWRIDARQLRHNFGDVAYAIPSPERRNSGNWVLETVPLLAP
ncbi:MAG: aromatic ring-hydroxylating dioxygenase subunit alpha [Gammaproteobacteria bacterium]|jgi:phenylpropionate dioxygenase-like ring-hydroxylating dioxygenase large terminal subunit|nr:aromatic ring-hydroxylating dioxygenase subunit alpha [Gammaproteobacteria bacterium]